MVGARAADTKELILKPWGILSSDILMHAALSIRCTHNFKHQPLLGGANCAQSAFYPKTMCRRICKVVLEHPIWKLRNCMRANDLKPTESALPAFNVPLRRRDQGLLDLDPNSPDLIEALLRKCHNNFGHPSHAKFFGVHRGLPLCFRCGAFAKTRLVNLKKQVPDRPTESGKRVLKRISKNKLPYGLKSWPDDEGR